MLRRNSEEAGAIPGPNKKAISALAAQGLGII